MHKYRAKNFCYTWLAAGRNVTIWFPVPTLFLSLSKRMSVLVLLLTSSLCKRVCLKTFVSVAGLGSICTCVKCSWTTVDFKLHQSFDIRCSQNGRRRWQKDQWGVKMSLLIMQWQMSLILILSMIFINKTEQ